MYVLASLAFLLAARLAQASVYVIDPIQSSTCTGGQSCEVQWVDNGEAPLLSTIGECTVGLYTGEYTLVQSLPSVDVSTTSSFTFTPDAGVGPNGPYYLVFTASSINYQGFSGSFTLAGMTGTTPSGGSSTSAPATTSATDSSTSAGSTTGTSPTDSVVPTTTAASGTSPSATDSTTPTPTTSAVDTSATLPTTTPVTTPSPSATTTRTTTATSQTSTSASATATGAAVRIGSSSSFGGIAAVLALSGLLAL